MKLHFPREYALRVARSHNGLEIFDIVRRKMVLLTPEEWVRQHLVHHLTEDLHYPTSLMRTESGLTYNRKQKRTDLLVYSTEGLPLLLAECKAPDVPVSDKAVAQLAMYQHEVGAKFLVLTNGMKHRYFSRKTVSEGFSPIESLPVWGDIVQQV